MSKRKFKDLVGANDESFFFRANGHWFWTNTILLVADDPLLTNYFGKGFLDILDEETLYCLKLSHGRLAIDREMLGLPDCVKPFISMTPDSLYRASIADEVEQHGGSGVYLENEVNGDKRLFRKKYIDHLAEITPKPEFYLSESGNGYVFDNQKFVASLARMEDWGRKQKPI